METMTVEVQKINEQALTWPDQARGIAIVDQSSFEQANLLTQGIQALRKQIKGVFDPMEEKAKEAKRAAEASRVEVVTQRATIEKPLVEAENILYPKIDAYVQEEKRKAREEEDRIRRVALQAEEDARLQAAIEAEANGDKEVADVILETPMPAPRVYIPIPKVDNLSFREDWSAEVINLPELVRAVAEGRAALAYLEPNLPGLNAQARSLRGEMKIPGVRAVMKRIPVRG
ncbi:MAG: hypothetical protein MUO24_02320 [Desulfobacterales bacterium]|nr:hypothetical protein [Desulfobacterales bacterium]